MNAAQTNPAPPIMHARSVKALFHSILLLITGALGKDSNRPELTLYARGDFFAGQLRLADLRRPERPHLRRPEIPLNPQTFTFGGKRK